MRVKLKVHRQPEEVGCARTSGCLPGKCIDMKWRDFIKERHVLQWKTWEVRVCMPSEAQMVLFQTAEAGHGDPGFSVHSVEF